MKNIKCSLWICLGWRGGEGWKFFLNCHRPCPIHLILFTVHFSAYIYVVILNLWAALRFFSLWHASTLKILKSFKLLYLIKRNISWDCPFKGGPEILLQEERWRQVALSVQGLQVLPRASGRLAHQVVENVVVYLAPNIQWKVTLEIFLWKNLYFCNEKVIVFNYV